MRPYYSILLLTVICILSSACVSRTTRKGSSSNEGKFSDKKLVWIWQDEFSNPKAP